MAIANLVVRIAADIADFEKNILGVERTLQRTGRNLESIGSRLTQGITVPLVAGIGLAAKAAIDFESSFAGVRKTVDATEAQFADLSNQFRDLAKTMPLSVNEINKVAEAAGQLGVSRERIVGFTETMVKLGATTNLTAEEAATAMARFSNALGQPEIDVNKLAAALVELGNKGASTEKDILDMAGRMAGAGAQIGLTAGEIFGMANALSSVGIEAEKGGSAISRLFNDLNSAVSAGGKELENFAKVAGLTGEAFRKLFKEDAAGAISLFVEGLHTQKAAGGDLLKILNELDITELRYRDTVLLAANAGEMFAESIRIGTRAFDEGEAANREYQERLKTTASQLKILQNSLNDVAITFGNAFLPILNSVVQASKPMVQALADMATEFGKLPAGVQNTVFALAGLLAAVGPVTFAIGKVTTAWASLLSLVRLLIPDIGAAATAVQRFGGPLALLAGAIAAVKMTWDDFNRSTTEGLKTLSSAIPPIGLTVKALEALGRAFPGLRDAMDDIATIVKNSLIIALNSLRTSFDTVRQQMLRTVDVLARTFAPVFESAGVSMERFASAIRRLVIPAIAAAGSAAIQAIPGVRGLLELIAVLPGFEHVSKALDSVARSTQQMVDASRGGTQAVTSMSGAFVNGRFSVDAWRDSILKGDEGFRVLSDGMVTFGQRTNDNVVKPLKLAGDAAEKAGKKAAEAAEKLRKFYADLFPGVALGAGSLPGLQFPIPEPPADLSKFSPDQYLGLSSLPGLQFEAPKVEPIKPGFFEELFGKVNLKEEFKGFAQGIVGSLADAVRNGDWAAFRESLKQGIVQFASAAIASGIDLLVPGLGNLLQPLIQAFTEVFVGLFDRNRGRDLVKDFAESFGGFDSLHKRLGELGAAGEALWIKLTQGVGRNNPEQAAAVIAEVQAALDAFGTEAERAASRLEGIGTAIEGVNAKAALFAAPFDALLKSSGDVTAKLAEMGQRGQAEFERLGTFAAAAFAGMVKESGDAIGALNKLSPTLSVLQRGLSEFKLTSTGTIDALLGMFSLVNDAVTGPIFQSIQATGQIFAGLQQGGLLTSDLFQTVATDIGASFRELEAKGGDVAKAMALSQPVLQRLWEAQQIYGDITDDTTKKILQQAHEQGLVGAHMKDVNQKILDVLLAIGDVLGAKIPDALRGMANTSQTEADRIKQNFRDAGRSIEDEFRQAGRGIEDSLSKIKIPNIKIGVDLDLPNRNPIRIDPETGIPSMGRGGIVRRPTLALIGEAGPEAVVPLSHLSNIQPTGGGGTAIIELDGRVIAEATVPHFPGVVRQHVRPR